MINYKCNARCKNNLLKQCSFKIHNNSMFCKKHSDISVDSKYNINNPLFSIEEIKNFLYNCYKKDIIDISKIVKSNILITKYILQIYNYKYNDKLTVKNTIEYFNDFLRYYKNLKLIIKIQSIIRKNNILKINELKGPGLLKKNKSNNSEDFYTFQTINSIKYNEFFSYKEKEHIYSFDVRSFKILIDNSDNNKIYNPYNRNIIDSYTIEKFTKLLEYLKKNNLFTLFEEEVLTKEQQNTQDIIKIFQKIDSFGYNTDITWFSNLTYNKLFKLWFNLEDIWNYRANLSNQEKQNIINNSEKPFLNFYKFNKYRNIEKEEVQQYILKDFDLLLSNGINKDYSNIGCLYILTALSSVSYECLTAMPWLNQIFI